MAFRWVNVALGIWLVIAAFVLPNATMQAQTNEFWTGLAVIVIALGSIKVSSLRFINSGLGLWLAASPFLLAYEAYATTINDVVVGLAIIIASLVPNLRRMDVPTRRTVTP